jgi:hypothetical protein
MTTSSKSGKILIPTANKKGYEEAHEGDGVIWKWKGARGTVQRGGVSNPDDRSSIHGRRREEEKALLIPCWAGRMEAREGDSIGITFMLSGTAHTPVTEGMSRTITTMSDHDIGVCVKRRR